RAERELLLETWNRTEAAYPSELCVHQLFEEQVRRSPDATALVQDEVSLSYGELNRRANRLAHHLIGLGVRPDERVAICLERSPAMVVGLLAILKAGGAYVPLDPAYPSERLGRILADAGPRLLLTDGVGRAVLGEACSGHTVLALDRPLPGEAGLPEGDPDPAELGLTAG
ncbi:AMP-binding protein, partial [Methylobacterium phyllosphaerae]